MSAAAAAAAAAAAGACSVGIGRERVRGVSAYGRGFGAAAEFATAALRFSVSLCFKESRELEPKEDAEISGASVRSREGGGTSFAWR